MLLVVERKIESNLWRKIICCHFELLSTLVVLSVQTQISAIFSLYLKKKLLNKC